MRKLRISRKRLASGVILGGEGETLLGKEPKPFPTLLKHDNHGCYLDISGFYGRVTRNMNIFIKTSLQVWVFNDKPTYKLVLHPLDLVNIPNVGRASSPMAAPIPNAGAARSAPQASQSLPKHGLDSLLLPTP